MDYLEDHELVRPGRETALIAEPGKFASYREHRIRGSPADHVIEFDAASHAWDTRSDTELLPSVPAPVAALYALLIVYQVVQIARAEAAFDRPGHSVVVPCRIYFTATL